MRRFKFFYFLLSCTIILGADMLMSINWTFFCFLIAATIYSYRCGLHSMWFQSSWQKLPQKAWMGLARRDLHGKKEVRFTNYVIWNLMNFWSNAIMSIMFCSDYYHIKRQIESELIQSGGIASSKPFLDLSKPEHLLKLKDRLKKYCQKVLFSNSWVNSLLVSLRWMSLCHNAGAQKSSW